MLYETKHILGYGPAGFHWLSDKSLNCPERVKGESEDNAWTLSTGVLLSYCHTTQWLCVYQNHIILLLLCMYVSSLSNIQFCPASSRFDPLFSISNELNCQWILLVHRHKFSELSTRIWESWTPNPLPSGQGEYICFSFLACENSVNTVKYFWAASVRDGHHIAIYLICTSS